MLCSIWNFARELERNHRSRSINRPTKGLKAEIQDQSAAMISFQIGRQILKFQQVDSK